MTEQERLLAIIRTALADLEHCLDELQALYADTPQVAAYFALIHAEVASMRGLVDIVQKIGEPLLPNDYPGALGNQEPPFVPPALPAWVYVYVGLLTTPGGEYGSIDRETELAALIAEGDTLNQRALALAEQYPEHANVLRALMAKGDEVRALLAEALAREQGKEA